MKAALFKLFRSETWQVTVKVNKEEATKLQEVSKFLKSGRLQTVSFQVLPEDLIPEEYHQVVTDYMLACMSAVYRVHKVK
jgi:hypothetical protein